MFCVFKARRLWIVIISLLVLCIILGTGITLYCYLPRPQYVIVIDAGHGGSDNGVIGINSGIKEAEINLLVARSLKDMLENRNMKVVLTREKESVIVEGESSKKKDFSKRREIINACKPDVVISIHQNKFPDASRRGAQVFYNGLSEKGKNLGNAVQHSLNDLNKENVGRTFSALRGDYYILNCSSYTSCIVECGFLSNPEDEKLLLDENYRQRLTSAIAKGIMAYLNESSI